MSHRRFVGVAVAFAVGSALSVPVAAWAVDDPSAPVDVTVARSPVTAASNSPNDVPLVVSVFDHATRQPAPGPYDVLLTAEDANGTRTVAFPCEQQNRFEPASPPNAYACTATVDHGGRWTFSAAAHRANFNTRVEIGVTLGQGSVVLDIDAPTLNGVKRNQFIFGNIKGHARDPLILGLHSLLAMAWLAIMGLLIVLALPTLRRLLSEDLLHAVEVRWDTLVRTTTALVAGTVLTGTYLLLKATAYRTPWTPARVQVVFRLPYGEPYFLALAVKLAIYAVMVVASLVVIAEARRRTFLVDGLPAGSGAGSGLSDDDYDDASIWDDVPAYAGPTSPTSPTRAHTLVRASSSTSVVGRTVSEAEAPSARIAAFVIGGGATVVVVCVTLLKYFHELVEASRALVNHL